MTLATGHREGAWSAPVYYLFADRRFYFFSSPDSRHVKEGESRACGASIFRDDPCFQNLKGVQMAGTILSCNKGSQAVQAAWAFCRRHGLEMENPENPGSKDILNMVSRAFHARLYRFEPDLIFYMDNGKGFGNRIRVDL